MPSLSGIKRAEKLDDNELYELYQKLSRISKKTKKVRVKFKTYGKMNAIRFELSDRGYVIF